MDDTTHQSDSDALASALGAIGGSHHDHDEPTHHFHHQLQAPDFSSHISHNLKSPLDQHISSTPTQDDFKDEAVVDVGHVDVDGLDRLEIPIQGEDEMDLGQAGEEDLDLTMTHMDDVDDYPSRGSLYGRPPSIRKACDLCHAAKQVRRCALYLLECMLTVRNAQETDRHARVVMQEDGHVSMRLDSVDAPCRKNKS